MEEPGMTENDLSKWLDDSVEPPTAIVSRTYLVPVEGRDGVFFPPTYAASENKNEFPGGYNIDDLGGGEKVCLVDSVGSQANRIEPIFATEPYRSLVPQLVVVAGSKRVNLLEAGHRAADAIFRFSSLKAELDAAFAALGSGNAVPLAKLAPTSLVFGVWDSRGTQVKAPRLLAATVRAFKVRLLTRSAQYTPSVDYIEEQLLDDTEDKNVLKAYSEQGFNHVPASSTHGGVIAEGDIRREATLQLAALRLLRGADEAETERLRTYLLGLALVAFTKPAVGYLRQGCNLVVDAERKSEHNVVYPDGRREPFTLTHDAALQFARRAAKAFGVAPDREVVFDSKLAKESTTSAKKKTSKQAKG